MARTAKPAGEPTDSPGLDLTNPVSLNPDTTSVGSPNPQASTCVDPARFEEFVERYFGTIYCVVLGYVGSREASEDIAQETLLRAYLKLSTLRDPDRLLAWALRIARHLATDSLRSSQSATRLVQWVSLDEMVTEPVCERRSAWESIYQCEESRLVRDAVLRLPRIEREVVLMHFAEDLSRSEVARRLRIHPSSVTRRLESALLTLRNRLRVHIEVDLIPFRSRACVRRTTVAAALLMALPETVRAQAIQSPTLVQSLHIALQPVASFFRQAFPGQLLSKAGKMMKSHPLIPACAAVAAAALLAISQFRPSEARAQSPAGAATAATTDSVPASMNSSLPAPASQTDPGPQKDPVPPPPPVPPVAPVPPAAPLPQPAAAPAPIPGDEEDEDPSSAASNDAARKTETRKLEPFQAINVSGSARVQVQVGAGSHEATVTANEAALTDVGTDVEDGVLNISPNSPRGNDSESPRIVVQVEKLSSISIAGSARVELADVLADDQLKINVSGSGRVSGNGTAKSVAATITGSGRADISKVVAQDAAVRIIGSGKAIVNATATLAANVTGSGTVTYLGNPTITKTIIGSGEVIQQK